MVSLALIGAPSSFALPVCSTLTPALGESVTCRASGIADIVIPVGSLAVDVVVDGAGGGGTITGGGVGGAGARVQGRLTATGSGVLRIVVGAGGAGQAAATSNGGLGGGYSAIFDGATTNPGDVLVVAGGGGGAGASPGYDGGAGSASGTAAGGDGLAPTGVSGTRSGIGADGTGNGAPPSSCLGAVGGQAWSAGGAGGVAGLTGDGSGGNGFGGGGSASGGNHAGGGAGASYALSSRLLGSASFSAAGGAGGANGASSGSDGNSGAVTLTFIDVLSPVLSGSPAPSYTLTWDHGDGTTSSTTSAVTTWVATPGVGDVTIPGRVLLGWSTSRDFPVSMALAATSAFDGLVDGKRVIYLPASQQTEVSGDNTLYAVWSAADLQTRIC